MENIIELLSLIKQIILKALLGIVRIFISPRLTSSKLLIYLFIR